MMRSLTGSAPGGPPSGPAKRTRPPSRAMPTAAFAAQPPPVTMNSEAATFSPGRGKRSTRMTMSWTAIPAQRIAALSEEDIGSVLDPAADDVVGDGHRRRGSEAVRMRALEHAGDLVAREPARGFELMRVHDDVGRQCLRVAADHQRRREWPGLRGEVADLAAAD